MNSNILFGLMQPDLRSSIYEEIMQEKADKTKKINVFNGYIDTIRNMRNIINHYESIVVYFTQRKNIRQTLKTIYSNNKY